MLVRFLVEHDAGCDVARAFLSKLLGVDEVEGLLVAEVDIVTEDVRVNELPHVLLLVVAADALVLKLAPDLSHLLVHDLLLLVLRLAVPNVSDVDRKTPHRILLIACH